MGMNTNSKWYLKIDDTYFSSDNYTTIANYLADYLKQRFLSGTEIDGTTKLLNEWAKEGAIGGIVADYGREAFIHWEISKEIYIKNLDETEV